MIELTISISPPLLALFFIQMIQLTIWNLNSSSSLLSGVVTFLNWKRFNMLFYLLCNLIISFNSRVLPLLFCPKKLPSSYLIENACKMTLFEIDNVFEKKLMQNLIFLLLLIKVGGVYLSLIHI